MRRNSNCIKQLPAYDITNHPMRSSVCLTGTGACFIHWWAAPGKSEVSLVLPSCLGILQHTPHFRRLEPPLPRADLDQQTIEKMSWYPSLLHCPFHLLSPSYLNMTWLITLNHAPNHKHSTHVQSKRGYGPPSCVSKIFRELIWQEKKSEFGFRQ